MNRFVLVHFVGRKYSPGYTFNTGEWPLHVTLVINFSISYDAHELGHLLEDALKDHAAFTVKGEVSKLLNSSSVVTLTKSPELVSLHTDLVNLLEKYGAEFDAPEYMWDNYTPHVTDQKSGHIKVGDEVRVDSVSLVDVKPHHATAQKMVLSTLSL